MPELQTTRRDLLARGEVVLRDVLQYLEAALLRCKQCASQLSTGR